LGAWRLLRDGAGTPAFNMAVDSALLRGVDGRPVLRLYAWEPAALSLGWFQPSDAFTDAAAAAGAVIVRRPTGGGAIHHDRELTFCLVATPGRDGYPAGVQPAYEFVHDVLREALATLGVELRPRGGDAPLSTRPRDATLCFDDHTALDLLDAEGRKVVGSAQRRAGGRVLHHGSIPLEVPSLTPEAGSLTLAAGRPVGWDEAADALVAGFSSRLPGPMVSDTLSPEERERVERLVQGDSDAAAAGRADASSS